MRPEDETHVRVWDLPVRLFHWSIVGLLCLSWFSAEQGYMRVHLISGLSMLALLLFRLGRICGEVVAHAPALRVERVGALGYLALHLGQFRFQAAALLLQPPLPIC